MEFYAKELPFKLMYGASLWLYALAMPEYESRSYHHYLL